MEKQIITLEDFAELINEADEWKLEFDDIIFANDWTEIFDEWHICHDGKNMIYFDDNGQAKVTTIEEAETKQIDKDFKLFQMIEELENSVKERHNKTSYDKFLQQAHELERYGEIERGTAKEWAREQIKQIVSE